MYGGQKGTVKGSAEDMGQRLSPPEEGAVSRPPPRWLVLIAVLALGAPAAGQPAVEAGPVVVGVVSGSSVVVAGVPLASGPWGTDYITVSHALAVGGRYAILRDGAPFADSVPVAACSNAYHGVEVLILRVAAHPNSPVAHWGDPAELRVGDELMILPRREIHPRPSPVRFLHTTLTAFLAERQIQWTPPRPWRNVMVGEGFVAPGFSGSPWVRDGRVYGLTKGWVQPPGPPVECPPPP